jgi:ABC-type ATPase with predicted acetyltransferase domain
MTPARRPSRRERIVDVTIRPTERLCRACAAFGVGIRQVHRHRRTPAGVSGSRLARRALDALPEGGVALVTGPSGSGKSTLLGRLAAEAARRRLEVVRVPGAEPGRGAIIDLIPGPLGEAIATLARAGLADATLLGRTPDELSEGERFRLSLALGLHRARSARPARAPILVVDEFAATLDRATARSLARGVHRWAARERARVVCATAHDDLADALTPHLSIVLALGGAAPTLRTGDPG